MKTITLPPESTVRYRLPSSTVVSTNRLPGITRDEMMKNKILIGQILAEMPPSHPQYKKLAEEHRKLCFILG